MAEDEGGGGGGNVFTRKVGPLPMWAWMAIALAVALGYYLIKSKGAKSSNDASGSGTGGSSTTDSPGGTDSSLVPQFVNQTYVNSTPPTAPAMHGSKNTPVVSPGTSPKAGEPIKAGSSQLQLTRTWEASATASTLSQVGGRLGVTDPSTNLHPANATASNWMKNQYSKNKNSKIPKGALFTYTEGTITDKS
jgi:hypothetical protein